jgi:hypothetical protein
MVSLGAGRLASVRYVMSNYKTVEQWRTEVEKKVVEIWGADFLAHHPVNLTNIGGMWGTGWAAKNAKFLVSNPQALAFQVKPEGCYVSEYSIIVFPY